MPCCVMQSSTISASRSASDSNLAFCLTGSTSAAVAGDDPELRVVTTTLGARDQQRLVGRRNMPEQHDPLLLSKVRPWLRHPDAPGGKGVTKKTERARDAVDDDDPACLGTGSVRPCCECFCASANQTRLRAGPDAGIESILGPPPRPAMALMRNLDAGHLSSSGNLLCGL